MKRGQIAGRLLLIIFSWVLLLLIVVVALLLKPEFGRNRLAAMDAVQTPDREVVLSSYLRQSVDLGGDKVPFAEVLAQGVEANDQQRVKQVTTQFLKSLDNKKLNRILITLPDGSSWAFGDSLISAGLSSSATLPLPNGKVFTVAYTQTTAADENAASQGQGAAAGPFA